MKIFLKIFGVVFLMILSAIVALGIGSYIVAKETDEIISQQLGAQLESANQIKDKFSEFTSEEQKRALEEAIAQAQKAVDDTGLNPIELIQAAKELLNQIANTINSIDIPIY